ncbi:MAG: ATPase domain-containing protein [Halobacteria archaeon]
MGRIKTFIDGFDAHLGGGIPEGHIVLLCGTPGTMKSTVGYYILWHNAKERGLKGSYISLEQDEPGLVSQMDALGMKREEVREKMGVLDVGRLRRETKDFGWKKGKMDIIKTLIEEEKKRLKFDLMVLDSLNIQELMSPGEDKRIDIFDFFGWLKELKCTSLVISEMLIEDREFGRHGAGFLSDGIFLLSLDRVDEIHRRRRITCMKMRGTAHSTDSFALILKDGRLIATEAILE